MSKSIDSREAGSSLTRRRFLAKSATAAAAVTIVKPRLVRGTQANARIRVGCIGLGGRGAWIARHVKEQAGYEITAVTDYFPEVAQKIGEELGVAEGRRFSGLKGYQRMLETDVEAVICKTPPYCFPEHVTAAVEAGCHVYMAKPIACDVPGTLQVAEAAKRAKKNKKVFLVDFQTRTDPFYIEAIRRVHAGDIGGLRLVNVFGGSDGFRDPPKTDTIASRLQGLIWVNDLELGGGYPVNYDVHAIDVAMWVVGKRPIKAMGCGHLANPDAHGNALRAYSVTYQFEDEVIINFNGEQLPNTKSRLDCNAYGVKGYLETSYGGRVWIRGNIKPYKGGSTSKIYGAGMQANIATFHKSITEGNYDNPTVQPSVDTNLASILGREAARRKTVITWDEMIKENQKLEVDFKGLKD